jgi:carbon-monoxide dehydrogenase medium subunit
VKPPPFEFVPAASVEEAVAALAEGGDDAKPLAGGQSLVPALTMRLVRPSVLVDVTHAGLSEIAVNGAVRIGATVRQAALAGDERIHPLVRQALPFVGHFVTRNRGTVGGSIAHADGAAELPLCLAVLDGTVVAESARGRREIGAADFFVTHFLTTLEPGELLVETVWPSSRDGEESAFEEFALRAGDFAQSMAAVVLRREDGVVRDARVGVGAVTGAPTRLAEVEALLVGSSGIEAAADAGTLAARLVDPPSTTHASSAYLRALTGTLVRRAIEGAR